MFQLKEIFASLQRHDVKYLLCGGLAVNLYGIPRMTADIDVLIERSEENVERFEKALHENGYKNILLFELKMLTSSTTRLQDFREKKLIAYSYSNNSFQAISLDVLVETGFDFKTCWERKEIKFMQGISVYLLGLEDLIAMKEAANREQDKSDVINLKKFYKRD